MPYEVVEDAAACSEEEPFAVRKIADGELMGCHPTAEDAQAQVAALYAAEKNDDEDEYAGKTAPWRGPLAVEGTVTGDGREFAEGALTWADLPLPLRWNMEDSHGGEPHTVAVNVGRIDAITREGDQIMGSGVLNLDDPNGERVYNMIKGKFLRGVSIDADSITDADVEMVWPESDTDGMDDDDPLAMLFAQPEKMIFKAGRIRAATLVDIPAFAEAFIELTDNTGAVLASSSAADYVAETAVVTASVAVEEWAPPAQWFADPKLSVPTGITIDASGRVYGHAAQWGTCHVGYADECVSPPHEDVHDYFMAGEVKTADGQSVSVGQITVGTGHASLSAGHRAAAEHYDHTGFAVADVAVGNDAHGIWVAGAVRPSASSDRVHELRASGQVSGDWRRIGGKLRLVGLLAVNVPGFPVPRMRARVASGAQHALVAAGRPSVVRRPVMEEKQAMRIVMDMLRRRVMGGE